MGCLCHKRPRAAPRVYDALFDKVAERVAHRVPVHAKAGGKLRFGRELVSGHVKPVADFT